MDPLMDLPQDRWALDNDPLGLFIAERLSPLVSDASGVDVKPGFVKVAPTYYFLLPTYHFIRPTSYFLLPTHHLPLTT